MIQTALWRQMSDLDGDVSVWLKGIGVLEARIPRVSTRRVAFLFHE